MKIEFNPNPPLLELVSLHPQHSCDICSVFVIRSQKQVSHFPVVLFCLILCGMFLDSHEHKIRVDILTHGNYHPDHMGE